MQHFRSLAASVWHICSIVCSIFRKCDFFDIISRYREIHCIEIFCSISM